jgi:hypothetical protein
LAPTGISSGEIDDSLWVAWARERGASVTIPSPWQPLSWDDDGDTRDLFLALKEHLKNEFGPEHVLSRAFPVLRRRDNDELVCVFDMLPESRLAIVSFSRSRGNVPTQWRMLSGWDQLASLG